mgnify:CR=1 FL=1
MENRWRELQLEERKEVERILAELSALVADYADELVWTVEAFAELDLAPGPPDLHVGQHLLEVADSGGQRLHLAQPLVDRFEALAHLLERLGQALLEVGMYDPVDGQRLPVLGLDADPEQRRILLRNLIHVQRMEP